MTGKNEKSTVLLTGATGLLGSYLLKILLTNGSKVYALARDRKYESGCDRVKKLLNFWDGSLSTTPLKNLTVISGDITLPNFGLKQKNIIELLQSEVEIIFHCAALTTFYASIASAWQVNVEGTKHVLNFGSTCKSIKIINHVSTAFVVGDKKECNFNEEMLELGQGFHNTYEKTKYEAELLTKEYQKKGLPIAIIRPSIIIGDSQQGKTSNFNFFYEPHRFFSRGLYTEFPLNANCSLNLINIDTAAKAVSIVGALCVTSAVYHIVSPRVTSVSLFSRLSSDYFDYTMPAFTSIEKFDFSKWTNTQKRLAKPFIPYCNYTTQFASTWTQNVLRQYGFVYPNIDKENLLRVFQYCEHANFIEKNVVGKL